MVLDPTPYFEVETMKFNSVSVTPTRRSSKNFNEVKQRADEEEYY